MQNGPKEIQKDNLEAQISKLKLIAAKVVAKTREVVEIKEGYLLEVENLENEIADKNQTISELVTSTQEAETRKTLIEDGIKTIEEKSAEDSDRRLEQIKNLDTEIRDKEALVEAKNREITTLENILPVISEQVANHREVATKQKEQVDLLTIGAQMELDDVNSEIEDKNKALIAVNKKIEDAESVWRFREEALKLRETELASIAEDYAKNNKKLATDKADMEVIKRRIKRKYEELYPDRKLII